LDRCPFRLIQKSDNDHVGIIAPDPNSKFKVPDNTTADHAKALFDQWSRQQPQTDHHQFKYLLANPANDTTDEHQPEDMEIDVDFGNADDNFQPDEQQPNISPPKPASHSDRMVQHYTGNAVHESVQRGHFAATGFEGFRSEANTMVIEPHTSFQSHLLAELMKFRGVPLAAYDSVMETLRFWALEMQLDFNRRDIYRSRKSLLHHLKKVYHICKTSLPGWRMLTYPMDEKPEWSFSIQLR
jgi:hypothetical protein